jgi:hypothetical protein
VARVLGRNRPEARRARPCRASAPVPDLSPATTRKPELLAALALAVVVAGCGAPSGRPGAAGSGAVSPPRAEGRSDEFKQMKAPPGQLTRVIPVGDAYPAEAGPVYRSLCLRCHSTSQTSFAVQDWRQSLHARAGVLCSACHGSHEAGFVPQPGPARCLTCHSQEVEEFLVSGHGPSRAPGMRCVSCHESHATGRGLAKSTKVCTGCHLDSDHVQGFAASRMGQVQAQFPAGADGEMRAPDCVYCHMPLSPIMATTGDFRNDKVLLHDPSPTVARHLKDERRLAESAITLLLPLCVSCHSERNARYRLENSDPLILHWTPVGMSAGVRRAPSPPPDGPAARAGHDRGRQR